MAQCAGLGQERPWQECLQRGANGQWCLRGKQVRCFRAQTPDSNKLGFTYGSTTWASHFTSVSPGFLVCKIRVIIVPSWIAMNEVTCVRGLSTGEGPQNHRFSGQGSLCGRRKDSWELKEVRLCGTSTMLGVWEKRWFERTPCVPIKELLHFFSLPYPLQYNLLSSLRAHLQSFFQL